MSLQTLYCKLRSRKRLWIWSPIVGDAFLAEIKRWAAKLPIHLTWENESERSVAGQDSSLINLWTMLVPYVQVTQDFFNFSIVLEIKLHFPIMWQLARARLNAPMCYLEHCAQVLDSWTCTQAKTATLASCLLAHPNDTASEYVSAWSYMLSV